MTAAAAPTGREGRREEETGMGVPMRLNASWFHGGGGTDTEPTGDLRFGRGGGYLSGRGLGGMSERGREQGREGGRKEGPKIINFFTLSLSLSLLLLLLLQFT